MLSGSNDASATLMGEYPLDSGMVLFEPTPPFRVLAHNAGYQSLWPEPLKSRGLVGLPLEQYLHGAEERGILRMFREVAASGEAKTVAGFPHDFLPGDTRWFNWSLAPVLRDGKTVALSKLTVEVTSEVKARLEAERERDAALARVAELEAMLRAVPAEIEHAAQLLELGDGFFELDRDWRIIGMNGNQEKLTRRSRDELAGQILWECFPYAASPECAYRREFEHCMEQRVPVRFQEYYAPLDLWTDITAYPVLTGGIAVFSRDVTQRVRTEQALRASEEKFRSVFQTAAVGIGRSALDGRLLEVNESFARLLGYTVDELVGMEIQSITHPDDLEPGRRLLEQLVAGDIPSYTQAKRYLRKDGGVVWVQLSVALARDAAWVPCYCSAVVADLGEQRRAQEALKEGEKLLKNVLATMPVGVWILDARGYVTQVNKAGDQLWAGTRYVDIDSFDQYQGWWVDSGERVKARDWPGARALTRGETILDREVEIGCFDGSRKIVLISAVPLRNEGGEITGAIVINQEITARKRVEDDLRRKEAKLRAVFDSLVEGVVVVDTDGRPISANDAVRRVYGHSSEELTVPGPDPRWRVIRSDGTPLPEGEQPGMVALRTGEAVRDVEIGLLAADGALRWRLVNAQPVRDESGELLGAVVSFFDITDRKRIEEELQKAHAELEQRVEERTAELEATVGELAEKEHLLCQQSRFAAMGEMIGNIAHQWRQPLNTLGLHVQTLSILFGMGLMTEETLNETVQKSMLLIKHMSDTIDDFRNFFRPEKEKSHFRLNEVLNNALNLVEGSFRNLQIEVLLDYRGNPVVHGYPNEYAQVILNVLSNARDAIESRRPPSPQVTISTGSSEGRSRVTIRDNAGGIDEGIIYKVFDPHFTTKGSQGTGIGLFMAKTIIEKNMNGRMSVHNTGDGAEFRIEV